MHCTCLCPAFAGTQCTYPRRDGQAELTGVASYIPKWFIHLQVCLSICRSSPVQVLTGPDVIYLHVNATKDVTDDVVCIISVVVSYGTNQ